MTQNIQVIPLRNGARLLVEEIRDVRSAAAGIFIQVGSRNETAELSGASHFTEHMLFKGTADHSAREIAELFENLGGQLNAYTAREYTCVYGKTLDEDIHQGLELMLEMVFASSMAENEFATEKKVVMEEISMYEDTPDELVHDRFSQGLYGNFSMGHPILGTLESVGALTRDRLFQYYKEHYTADNIIIAVAGNVRAEEIQAVAEAHMPAEEKPHKPYGWDDPENYHTFVECIPKQLEQVHICLGVPGIPFTDERRHTQSVMNHILGGGMSSRLFQSLREQRGLAYSVYSYTACYQNGGAAGFYIGTGPEKIPEFFKAFFEEVEKFIQDGITDEELERTRKMLKSNLYMGLENTNSRMTRLARGIMMYGKYTRPEEVVEKIYAVQKADVQDFARSIYEKVPFSMCAIGSEAVLPRVQAEFEHWYR